MDSSIAATISRFKKERFLRGFSEDDFRDSVLRPLLLRQGLKDGRDLCGPQEKGKDTVFVSIDKLGMNDIYVVQTKKGNLNLAKEPSGSLIEAITQLKTALATQVYFSFTKEKKLPAKAILCASGKINESARQHIVHEVGDPRIVFMDADDLIPKIDEHCPELWFGIDAQVLPYLKTIRKSIEELTEELSVSDILPGGVSVGAATDKMFVPVSLYRTLQRIRKERGQTTLAPKFEEIPLAGILRRNERLFLILGEAGSGKSTALRRLAYVITKRAHDPERDFLIPVLLKATEVSAKSAMSLVEICADETRRLTHSSTPSFDQQGLSAGNVVVLIDALDELLEGTARAKVLRLINEFHSSYPKCKVVLTSREYSFIQSIGELKAYCTYRLSPINYKQAEQIIDRFRKEQHLPIENTKEIIRRLQDVHGMELNPLLVTVFAATSEYSQQDIPANITELFKKFTEMMLGRWDASKGLAHQYQAPLKDFLLKKVAFEIHRRRATSMMLSEFQSVVESELLNRGYRADIGQILDETLHRSGLFRVVGGAVEFRHLLLQEFFAGRGIPSREFLETVVGEPWWCRAIVFYFGENAGDAEGIDKVMKSVRSQTSKEIYAASVTLGLAIQACYLAEVKDKIPIIQWVINSLSSVKEALLKSSDPISKFPISGFLAYYLFGRDSVASNILKGRSAEFVKSLSAGEVSQDEKDTREFWLIVGLIEAGAMREAEELIEHFRPSDAKLLLGIHLGCYLIQHIRVSSKNERNLAEKICRNLNAKIGHLRKDLLKEVRTELLEVRHDEIEALNPPDIQGKG